MADDLDDAAIWELMQRNGPTVVAARVRVRRDGAKVTSETESRSAQTSAEFEALVRWLPGAANRGGRTDESDLRLAEYAGAILALFDTKLYRPAEITARLVLARLDRTGSEAQLRKDVSDPGIGGWRQFREAVLRDRFSGR